MVQWCPDRQLLSVYFDGELPSPWKEKMAAHIAQCPPCARRLEAYQRNSLTPLMEASAAGEEKAVQERVWQKLEPGLQYRAERPIAKNYAAGFAAGWRRRISIPLPAAAAAMVLFAVLAFLIALRLTTTTEPSAMTFASEDELDAPGIIPVSNMDDVMQYLGSRDNGDIIILHLPESRSFVNYGEPAIIKAADYSRNVSNRNVPRGRKP